MAVLSQGPYQGPLLPPAIYLAEFGILEEEEKVHNDVAVVSKEDQKPMGDEEGRTGSYHSLGL